MAETEAQGKTGEGLLTLSEVSKRTGISMPTLQRYKKLYQSRLPTVGKGRKQRYRPEALEIFKEIKKENIGKRGRPRKVQKAAAGGRKVSGRAKASQRAAGKTKDRGAGKAEVTSGLLTLTQVSETTGISYPTLVRYVKLHGDRLPHEGTGRRRRFYPEAVDVFSEIRSESPRGRRRKGEAAPAGRRAVSARGRVAGSDAVLSRRVQALEKSQDRLEKQIKALIKSLQKPLSVTIQRK